MREAAGQPSPAGDLQRGREALAPRQLRSMNRRPLTFCNAAGDNHIPQVDHKQYKRAARTSEPATLSAALPSRAQRVS